MLFVSYNTHLISTSKIYLSFDGTSTRREASTNYQHEGCALGDYKNSPFVTGGYLSGQNGGLKTEILDYETGTWVLADDYPFSGSDEYVL